MYSKAASTSGKASPEVHDNDHRMADEQDLYGNAAIQDHLASAKGGPRAGAPRSKAAALKRHEENRSLVDKIIRSGLAIEPDPAQGYDSRLNLYRNSAQWIDDGQASLVVLSPTHDSEKRASVPADSTAYFDSRTTYAQAGATYDDTLDASGNATNDAGIVAEFSNVVGTMSGDGMTMTLIDPKANTEGYIVETLIHEVQHDADQHHVGDAWEVIPPASPASEPARAIDWNRFQSEFRAFWLENPEGSAKDNFGSSADPAGAVVTINAITSWGADSALGGGDDTIVSANTAFANKRQEDILTYMGMLTHNTDGDWWDYTNKRWNASYDYVFYYYAVDSAFKAMVDGYATPVTGNAINSPRIQDLSDALAAGVATDVWTAVQALDPLDQDYLSDRAASQPLWDQAQAALSPENYVRFKTKVGQAVVGPYIDSYTVVKGDTLHDIADRMLYDSSRWQEIYDMNKGAIGKDPNQIKEGTRLVLPSP